MLAGCLLGTFTGLIPGIHVNTAAAMLALLALPLGVQAAALTVGMALAHSFVNFLPAIALGAPDEGAFLAVLPGHRLLLQGRGEEAVNLTVAGGLVGGVVALALAWAFMPLLTANEGIIKAGIAPALLFVLVLTVLRENTWTKRALALSIVLLAGALGMLALFHLPLGEPLLPLISGLFGLSTLLVALIHPSTRHAKQKPARALKGRLVWLGALAGTVAGCIVAVLPSLGAGQAAFLVRSLSGHIPLRAHLALLGAVNTANALFAFFVLEALGKMRTGAAAAVAGWLDVQPQHKLLFSGAILLAVAYSVLMTPLLTKRLLRTIQATPYVLLNLAGLTLLTAVVGAFSGLAGLAVYATGGLIGVAAVLGGIRRTTAMAALMVPTFLIYLGALS